MTPAALIHVAEAPARRHPGDLHTHHRDDLAVVYVHADVSNRRLADCAMTVLAALGKREDVTGMRDHPSDNVHLTPIWLTAHGTQTVIIGSAQVWKPRLLAETMRLLTAAAVRVIVVVEHGRLAKVEEAISGFAPESIPWARIPSLLPASPPPTDNPGPSALATQSVPPSDWTTFRYDARRLLEPDAFAELDRRYLAALATARKAVVHGSAADDEGTRQLLVHLVAESANTQEVTAALRATQAAYFEAGTNLRIDVHQVLAHLSQSRTATFTASDWRQLRAYREPHRAAICTLYGHGLPAADIERFTVADAKQALDSGRIRDHHIGGDASTYLRANLTLRRIQGAADDDPFIECKSVGQALTAASRDLGLLVANRPNHRSQHTANFWQYRLGFLRQAIK